MNDLEEKIALVDEISDAWKDAYGSRHRPDPRMHTLIELETILAQTREQVKLSIQFESVQKLSAQRTWEARIESLMIMGARTRSTAIRWDMAALDAGTDVSFYCYLADIAYELEARIQEELRDGN